MSAIVSRSDGSIVVTVRLTLKAGRDDDLIVLVKAAPKRGLASAVREAMRGGASNDMAVASNQEDHDLSDDVYRAPGVARAKRDCTQRCEQVIYERARRKPTSQIAQAEMNVIQTGGEYGMQTMDQALRDLYREQVIVYDESIANATDVENLKRLIGREADLGLQAICPSIAPRLFAL